MKTADEIVAEIKLRMKIYGDAAKLNDSDCGNYSFATIVMSSLLNWIEADDENS